jgi:predicted RNA-binding Zn ribbon-like protein
MHWVEVDGCQLPKRHGGHPALELCNTRASWREPLSRRSEWLPGYDTLAVWSGYVELLDRDRVAQLRELATASPGAAESVLAEVRDLRHALYPTLLRRDAGEFHTVARYAERAARRMRLTQPAGAPARWRLPDEVELEHPLLAAAHSAAGLLCSPDRDRVRACPGDECGWLFLDRRGRRRWCSMEDCGNRSKARTFAERHRARH